MKDKRRDMRDYRNASNALKAKAKRLGLNCWLCHQPFDWSLHYLDAMAFTADHVAPLGQGGHILGLLQPAHRRCNSKRNDGRHEIRTPTTRKW